MNILLIDDDEDLCHLTKTVLTKYGHTVWAYCDPQAGLAYARQHRPNLIFMDVMLPGLSGPEIVAELRNDALLKDIPVVFLTGLMTGVESRDQEGIQVSGVKYPSLGKPYEIDQILNTVKKYAK